MRPLTLRTRLLLAYLRAYHRTHGKAPSHAEILKATRLKPASVHHGLRVLEARGYVRRPPSYQYRKIELTDEGKVLDMA